MDELTFAGTCERGSRGARVRFIQEWLTLAGHPVVMDASFGPATEEAVRRFQKARGLKADGVVGPRTHAALAAPMVNALVQLQRGDRSLGSLVVSYAKQHLRARPREVGGPNAGPWVRLYTGGKEGPDWPWCAAFVSYIVKQACETAGLALPLRLSPSCDTLAANAKAKGAFHEGNGRTTPDGLKPGALFLNRRTRTDWVHTGIVIAFGGETFDTIEGNTNDEGSFEGYEVCRRVRGYAGKDFIAI
jgi:hypothetical protein